MDLPTKTWEYSLLARAYEAFTSPASSHLVNAASATYDEAYDYCDRLIRANSRSFYLASSLLPRHKRRAVRALYAFCRATDDLIDQMPRPADARAQLASWQLRLSATPSAYDPIPLAWADTKARYRIPHGYETQLIEGIARDLCQHRYASFADLTEYCYGVASTVGLMVMHIVDFRGEAALPYAVKLGIALQLTNILRDVGADWQTGRLYLPLDELAHFGLSEADIALGAVDKRWRAFMRFQIARTRALYAEAEPGIALLDPEGRFAIAAAATLYRAILEDIEAHDFDVFRRRARVGSWGKIRRLPRTWWTTRTRAEPPAGWRGGA
ncbi:MAG TPA: squalene/phytoene synthase family protein [Ktedonobacterales bacterium]